MSKPTGPVHVPARPRSALFLSTVIDLQTADQEKRWRALPAVVRADVEARAEAVLAQIIAERHAVGTGSA